MIAIDRESKAPCQRTSRDEHPLLLEPSPQSFLYQPYLGDYTLERIVAMHISVSLVFSLAASASAAALQNRQASCTFERRRAGVQQEIATIRSHTIEDANKIPLAPLASRTFFITQVYLSMIEKMC